MSIKRNVAEPVDGGKIDAEKLEEKELQSKSYIEAGNSLVEAVKKFKVK